MNYKFLFSLIFCFLLWPADGFSDDSYNFYFVKDKNKKSEDKERVEEEASAPSVKEEKKVEKKKDYRKWVASLGIGSVSSTTGVSFPDSSAVTGRGYSTMTLFQSVYNLGMRYNWSRYFDFHGNLLLPRGQTWSAFDADLAPEDGFDFQFMAGLGTTPFHFYFLDFPFLEIGIDTTLVFGDPRYTGGNSVALILGPRVAVNFSRGFSTFLQYQQELFDSETQYGVGTWGFSYRW